MYDNTCLCGLGIRDFFLAIVSHSEKLFGLQTRARRHRDAEGFVDQVLYNLYICADSGIGVCPLPRVGCARRYPLYRTPKYCMKNEIFFVRVQGCLKTWNSCVLSSRAS